MVWSDERRCYLCPQAMCELNRAQAEDERSHNKNLPHGLMKDKHRLSVRMHKDETYNEPDPCWRGGRRISQGLAEV